MSYSDTSGEERESTVLENYFGCVLTRLWAKSK